MRYRTTQANYRKIYENHYGDIPVDKDGRSYEIHHIDGNHENNTPSNLKAIPIQEHYDIHYARGDYAACRLISIRMNMPVNVRSELSTLMNNKRVENGTHPWAGIKGSEHSSKMNKQRVKDGTHHFTSDNAKQWQQELVETGKHHLLGGEHHRKMVENGTHNMLGGEIQRRRVANGTHHLLGDEHIKQMLKNGTHASQVKKTCPHCSKTVSSNTYSRWHGDNCKLKENITML